MRSILCALFTTLLFNAAWSADLVWTGAASSDWSTGGNWDEVGNGPYNGVPTYGDSVSIPIISGQAFECSITQNADCTVLTVETGAVLFVGSYLTVNTLTTGANSSVNLSYASVTLNGNSTLAGNVAWNGSSVAINQSNSSHDWTAATFTDVGFQSEGATVGILHIYSADATISLPNDGSQVPSIDVSISISEQAQTKQSQQAQSFAPTASAPIGGTATIIPGTQGNGLANYGNLTIASGNQLVINTGRLIHGPLCEDYAAYGTLSGDGTFAWQIKDTYSYITLSNIFPSDYLSSATCNLELIAQPLAPDGYLQTECTLPTTTLPNLRIIRPSLDGDSSGADVIINLEGSLAITGETFLVRNNELGSELFFNQTSGNEIRLSNGGLTFWGQNGSITYTSATAALEAISFYSLGTVKYDVTNLSVTCTDVCQIYSDSELSSAESKSLTYTFDSGHTEPQMVLSNAYGPWDFAINGPGQNINIVLELYADLHVTNIAMSGLGRVTLQTVEGEQIYLENTDFDDGIQWPDPEAGDGQDSLTLDINLITAASWTISCPNGRAIYLNNISETSPAAAPLIINDANVTINGDSRDSSTTINSGTNLSLSGTIQSPLIINDSNTSVNLTGGTLTSITTNNADPDIFVYENVSVGDVNLSSVDGSGTTLYMRTYPYSVPQLKTLTVTGSSDFGSGLTKLVADIGSDNWDSATSDNLGAAISLPNANSSPFFAATLTSNITPPDNIELTWQWNEVNKTIEFVIIDTGGEVDPPGPTTINQSIITPAFIVSTARSTYWNPLCPGTAEGLTNVQSVLDASDLTRTTAYTWDADTQEFITYPTAPTAGFHPWTGWFIASRDQLTFNFAGAYTAAPTTAPLATGWNLMGFQAVVDGDNYITTHPLNRLDLYLAGGLTTTPQRGAAISGKTYLWNGSSYSAITNFPSGRGVWVYNASATTNNYLQREPSLQVNEDVKTIKSFATIGKSTTPPPLPSNAGDDKGGCGGGSGFGFILGLFAFLGLALRRGRSVA